MSETMMGGEAAAAMALQSKGLTGGRLVLLRHGQTAWSESGQYTGRTNIPLTAVGEQQAVAGGQRLRAAFPDGFDPEHVFVSPLRRAQQTAALAGFPEHRTLDDLAEWDYGRAEGRTRHQISEAYGEPWDVWTAGPTALPAALEGDWQETLPGGETVPVHAGAGESVDVIGARARQAIEMVRPMLEAGEDVLFVAHAHISRIVTTQWLGLDPRCGRMLRLDTAHYAVLGRYREDNIIVTWNR